MACGPRRHDGHLCSRAFGGSRLREAHVGRPPRAAAGARRADYPERLRDSPCAAARLWHGANAQLGAWPDRRPPAALFRRHCARHRSEPRSCSVLRGHHCEPPARQRHSVAVACGRWNAGARRSLSCGLPLAFAGPMLLKVGGRDRKRSGGAERCHGDRTPVLANFAAFGLFFALMIAFVGSADGPVALLLAVCGCLLAVAGSALVIRSRRELGSAWSFVPTVVQGTGLVTTGPYRLVRHPIYLGLSMLALGQALAFASWPAFLVLLAGIIPTLVWRAAAEEKVLTATFGKRYALYQTQTKMIIPHLL